MSSEGGDLSNLKVVHSEGTQRALRGHSESTYRVLREQSEIKKQSDFAIPSEPKILRLVFINDCRKSMNYIIICDMKYLLDRDLEIRPTTESIFVSKIQSKDSSLGPSPQGTLDSQLTHEAHEPQCHLPP